MYNYSNKVLLLNKQGLSNRAIAREVGVSRESVNQIIKKLGVKSPFSKRIVPLLVTNIERKKYLPGELVMSYRPEADQADVNLRAIAIKQYSKFIFCKVEVELDGDWVHIYNECFK